MTEISKEKSIICKNAKVDDEDMILYVGRDLLEKLGYKVLAANSGKETIKIYKKFMTVFCRF
jgi:CheY-like chemotaxis protein